MPPSRETGPRVNDGIQSPEIRLIGAEGENEGVVSPEKALNGRRRRLRLSRNFPNASPPVCKIMILENINTNNRNVSLKLVRNKK